MNISRGEGEKGRPVLRKLMFGMVTVVLVLALAGCGGDDGDSGDQTGDAPEPTATAEPAAEATATVDESEAATPTESGEPATATEPAEPTATESPAEPTPTESGAATEEAAAEPGPRTIEHSAGTTEIEGTPERIVALEWTYAEDLLALGIQPAGVADIDGYQSWVNVEPELASDVVDVGTRQEPSLETITELEPDLIIGVQFRHEPIYEDLSSIAPTLLFNPYPTDESITQLDEMEQTFMTIAEAVDRTDEAATVLEEMESRFDEARQTLEDAGAGGSEFVLVQAFTSQETPQIRVFTDNSMAVQIFESVGLTNAWDGEFNQYGFNTVGLEALTTVEQANFFYVVQEDDNPFAEQWADNPVWQNLAFVQEERTYPLGGDTWLFGGPLSAELIADKVVEAMAE